MSRIVLLLTRALRLRCPNCGGGPLFVSWFKLAPICPRCRLTLERDEGYWLGGMTINLIVGEVFPVVGVVGWWLLSRPHTPWDTILIAWIAAAIALPLLFFPLSRTLWLAFDLSFRPAEATDIAGDGESDAPPWSPPAIFK